MFDTIRLETPLVCPGCGQAEPTVQTHHFGETLDTYRIGMIVPDCPILTGILIETFWCSACHHADMASAPLLYVVIWHSILVAVEWQREEAERKLAGVDRLNLIEWLDRMQREAATWRRNYHALRSALERWHEYQSKQKEAPSDQEPAPNAKTRLASFFLPDEAIRSAADPLAAILERHPTAQDPDGLF